MLSAKLYEDRLIFINSEKIDFAKTTLLQKIVEPFGIDKLCFLVPHNLDENFEKASRAIENLEFKSPRQFNVPDLLNSDYIFVTKEGLKELEEVLEAREYNTFRNKKVPCENGVARFIGKRTN